MGDAIEGIVYTQDARIVRWVLQKRYGAPAGTEVHVEPFLRTDAA